MSAYLAYDHSTVIAAVRKLTDANAKSLETLPKGEGSQLITVEIDAAQEDAPATTVKKLQDTYNIEHLDVVIACTGICQDFSPVSQMSLQTLKEHVAVNGYGPILLFQAVLPLLEKSKQPKFVSLGTAIGSIGGMEQRPFPMAAYGVSKVMAHWAMRKIHFENPGLTIFTVEPG